MSQQGIVFLRYTEFDSRNAYIRYINDCIDPSGWNVTFDKQPEEKCAYVIATRNIVAGEELFVNYGKWYWAGKAPVRIQSSRK